MPLLPEDSAPQHERAPPRAPRPLPLFLELVAQVSKDDPALAREALAGLRAYERAPAGRGRAPRPEVARVRGARLRDHGGAGPPVVLVPSLINPPGILDLDAEVSLTEAIAQMGLHPLLLDWGAARERSELSVAGHVESLLVPLLEQVGARVTLLGYCLGGTMAIAAANLVPVERLVTLAAPWNFARYPQAAQSALAEMWSHSRAAAEQLGALPMEVLQAAFWSLDPARTVRKFAEFGRLAPDSADARRFVELEEWANEGEPLPYPAARELIEQLFGEDRPGAAHWRVGGRTISDALETPRLHLLARHDRIAPPDTAPAGDSKTIAAGHVGMIVGSARTSLQEALKAFVAPCR